MNLSWTEQSIKNCKSDTIVAVSDGIETYYADAEGLNARQAKADFISQCAARHLAENGKLIRSVLESVK